MKLLVIGLGSMGKRRIRLLSKHFPDIRICGADIDLQRRLQTEEIFQIKTYDDLIKAIDAERPNAVLVCTSPHSHRNIILDCVNAGLHVFSEINLLQDGYDEIIKSASVNNVELFLSSTLLYRKEIEIIKRIVNEQKTKINYRYHVGQYLPDWHPWDNRDFFVWNKSTNGCREIFAIDLPWITKTFGSVRNLTVLKDNLTALDIEYPDNYIVILEHANGNKGVFLADVVCRTAIRELLIYSENLLLTWNGTPNGLCQYNIEKKSVEQIRTYREIEKDNDYSESIIENAYLDELRIFLEKITGSQNRDRYTFEDDKEILRLIDRIEGIGK